MDKTLPEIARDALDVLDRNGWCKGATVSTGGMYPRGSNCMGGAVNVALWNSPNWDTEYVDVYRVFAEKIHEMFHWVHPWESDVTLPGVTDLSKQATYIASWNDDDDRTEAEVRAVLEKIAAEG